MAGELFVDLAARMMQHYKDNPDKALKLRSKFNSSQSFKEIFGIIWELEEAHRCLDPELIKDAKSDEMADLLREEGNEFYKKRKLDQALDSYNFSIMRATHPVVESLKNVQFTLPNIEEFEAWCPIDSEYYGGSSVDGKNESLAMGYGNRSAVMYEMQFYEKCLMDIDLALEHGYPESKKSKLLTRKSKCLESLKGSEGKKKATEKSEDAIDDLEEPKHVTCSDFGKLIPLFNATKTEFEIPPLPELLVPHKDPPQVASPNRKAPSLSAAVTISYSCSKGRGLYATRDIKTGEVLGRECSYASNLSAKEIHSYCLYCLRFCITPLPCPGCCKVIFCSIVCRNTSLSLEHWLECSLLPSMISLGLNQKSMVYKLLKNNTFRQMKRNLEVADSVRYYSPKDRGCNEKGSYLSCSYHGIHHLYQRIDLGDFALFLIQCQVAFVMTKLLEKSRKFFINKPWDTFTPTKEDLVLTGSVLLSNTLKFQLNPYELSDWQLKKPIAAGIYPTLSLINHSCNPNSRHYGYGRLMVLRAVRPIPAGQEITDSYVADFSEKSYQSRQNDLSGFSFKCTCEACEGGWPIYQDLKILTLKCIVCKKVESVKNGMCQECSDKSDTCSAEEQLELNDTLQVTSDKMWLSLYKGIKAGLRMSKIKHASKRDYDTICDTIETVTPNLSPPCQLMCDMYNILLRAFDKGR